MLGDLVGRRFRLGELAASGGMGRVYRALDERTGAPAAVKIVPRAGQLTSERFSREAQLLSRLEHPAIVRYLDHGTADGGELYLAMEWLDGEDLAHRLSARPLDLGETVALATRVAEALAFAHERGVVHRDIKPANLFLVGGSLDDVKVVDFGIARPIGLREVRGTRGASGELSITGIPVGTLGYMAPEQARGERRLDARVDVFALGCVLFECLARSAPFAAEHPIATLAKILLEEAPPLRTLSPLEVPEWLEALIASMLARELVRRPPDGGALVRAIAAHRDERSAAAGGVRLAEAPAITTSEKRLTSIVALKPAVALDGDESRELARLREIALGFGARLEPILGGALVAIVRASGSASDQVAQAARCALALGAEAAALAVSVATGFEALGQPRPTGGAIQRAFEQLDNAAAGDRRVRIDELTAGLIDGAFDVERDQARWWLIRPRREPAPGRTLVGRLTPFVGREKELALLCASLDETIAERSAGAMLVVAPAGMGKSRLRHELVHAARERHPSLQVWIGSGDAARQHTPLGLVADVISSAAGLRDDEPLSLRRQKLQMRIARRLRGDDIARVAELLGELAGVPTDDPSLLLQGARDDPRRMWEQTRRAWQEWLDAELAAGPILLVVEDAQWADPRSVQVLEESFARRERPLFLFAVGRPEAAERFGPASPGWPHFEELGLQTMRLQRLGRRASEALVRKVLGEDAHPDRIAAIAERAGGHAFFLEELLRAEVEGHGQDTPVTVVAMLQERIERFETDARRLLRAASVLGVEFCRGALAALIGEESEPERMERIDRWLETLVAREVIGLAEKRRFALEETYTFRHDLVREAVYATLTDEDRRRGHGLAARWLEEHGERDAATLAEHYAQGGDRESAARWWMHAAEQAYDTQDSDGALRDIERAISLGVSGEPLGRVRRVQAQIALARNSFHEVERFAAEALELLSPATTFWFHSATLLVTVASFGVQGRLGEVVGRVLQAGEPGGDAIGMAAVRAWSLCANMLYFAGQYALAAEFDARLARGAERAIANEPCAAAWVHFARHVRASYCGGGPELTVDEAARAAELLEQAGDHDVLVFVRIEEAKAAYLIGDFERADRLLHFCLDATDGMLFPHALTQHRLARLRSWQGAPDEALALQRAANALFQSQGLPVFYGVGQNQLALLLASGGELEAAARAAEEASAILYAAPPVRVYALCTAAKVALAQGRSTDGLSLLREAEQHRNFSGLINDGESLFELAFLETLEACGERDEARRRAAAARERLLQRASEIVRPEYRESFLHRVPDNAEILRRAAAFEGPIS